MYPRGLSVTIKDLKSVNGRDFVQVNVVGCRGFRKW